MNERCPVCAFDDLPYPPNNYHICPCCGTEFGNDDAYYSYAQLREMWVATGAHWFFGKSPERWNPWLQLIRGGYEYALAPRISIRFEGEQDIAEGAYWVTSGLGNRLRCDLVG
jgi:hypothetical protein